MLDTYMGPSPNSGAPPNKPPPAPPLQAQPLPSQPPNPNQLPNANHLNQQPSATGGPELSLNLRGPPRGTSAPSSPAKSRESLLQRVQSLSEAARDHGASILGAAVSSKTRPSSTKSFTLLVIDDQNTDWSKYFRGKRLHNDYEIRVEQAEFKEVSLTASGDQGTTVSMAVYRNGTKVIRAFRLDFVLIRQNLRDATEDHRAILLGLKFGGVPSINSLNSIYHFQDKPWVFAHLLQLQRRLGKENFPLIEQTYFPNHLEMVMKLTTTRFPVVLKIGHAHGGQAKVKVDNLNDLSDFEGVVALSNTYCTVEPYIDAKFDIHIQKIGPNYKAFMRKSISGKWKTNQGTAILEQLSMTKRYKEWVDEVSDLFGGLDIVALELVVGKDGREYIIEVNDSAMSLMGDTQEEDRRVIAELVATRMQNMCRPSTFDIQSRSSVSSRGGSPTDDRPPVPERPPIEAPLPDLQSGGPTGPTPLLGSLGRRDSQASQSSTTSTTGRPPPVGPRQMQGPPPGGSVTGEDTEDTMKNLRKTFAGIFGDM